MSNEINTRITLKNVRLSFPSLFKKAMFEGKEGKYEATFLIPKSDKKVYDLIQSKIKELLDSSGFKISKDKLCLKDCDDVEYAGYADHWSLKSSNSRRPTVMDSDKTPLTEEDNRIYAGCYVNAIVDFWVQNNSYGKRINSNLLGVQFLRDGESLGAAPVDVTELFDDLSADDFD